MSLRANSYEEAVARLRARRDKKAASSRLKPKGRTLGAGRRTKEWQAAWREIKPMLERRGITHCELGLKGCTRGMFLTPMHSLKRRNITTPEKLREVCLACQHCHAIGELLPEREMEALVMRTIDARPKEHIIFPR